MRSLAATFVLFMGYATSVAAQDAFTKPDLKTFGSNVQAFLKQHCLSCHGDQTQEGDVRLDQIDGDLVRGKSVSLWKDVLHRVETNEMPPSDEPQPTAREREQLTQWIRTELRKQLAAEVGVPGRVVVRRLSRTEYRNTMRDLLGLPDWIGDQLPPDTTFSGFDHVASVQELSRSQLETYLQSARHAIDQALVTGQRPLSFNYRADPELDNAGLHWRVNSHGIPENLERAKAFVADFRPGKGEAKMQADQWSQTYRFAIRNGHGRLGSLKENITDTGVWLPAPRKAYSAKGGDWGRIGLRLPHVPADSEVYRLRIKAGALQKDKLGKPLLSVWVFRKLLTDIEITASADDPEWYEFVFAKNDLQNVQIHSDDNRFSKTPITDIVLNNAYENPGVKRGRDWEVDKQTELPAVFIDSIELESHYTPEWPPKHHTQILFPSEQQDDPERYAEQVLTRFMSRAFRRPVRKQELASKMKLFQGAYAIDEDFVAAIKEPLVATLISPQFLFLAEDTAVNHQARRRLSDFELASRLSYFLWSTMPDQQLLELAKQGELKKPQVLRKEVDRMLADPKAVALHDGFMTQWLGLQKLDDLMIEDARWVVRSGLKSSMRSEPAALFAEMLKHDLSLKHFVDSDFIMINERLAQHYQIDGVYGNHFRKVTLPTDHQRGGLLTQAASLSISTDGMITSPIYRGKWVLEKILDLPPPPAPDNVPPLDDAPQERLSLREQFAKHRQDKNCAACHQKIDPLGWPFERFSIMGEFSEHGWGENWSEFNDPKRNKKDLRPDFHGLLPNGTEVETVSDLKQVIWQTHQDDFLRGISKNMLIYALGRPLDISDDPTVDNMVEQLKRRQLGARQLIHAVVSSPPFLEK